MQYGVQNDLFLYTPTNVIDATDFLFEASRLYALWSVQKRMTYQKRSPKRLKVVQFLKELYSEKKGFLSLWPSLEKLYGNRNPLERSDDKVPAEVLKLVSTFIEWHQIFYDCDKCLHLCECPALQRQASTNTQFLWFSYRKEKNKIRPQDPCFARFTSVQLCTSNFNTQSFRWAKQPKVGHKSHNLGWNRRSVCYCPQEIQYFAFFPAQFCFENMYCCPRLVNVALKEFLGGTNFKIRAKLKNKRFSMSFSPPEFGHFVEKCVVWGLGGFSNKIFKGSSFFFVAGRRQ